MMTMSSSCSGALALAHSLAICYRAQCGRNVLWTWCLVSLVVRSRLQQSIGLGLWSCGSSGPHELAMTCSDGYYVRANAPSHGSFNLVAICPVRSVLRPYTIDTISQPQFHRTNRTGIHRAAQEHVYTVKFPRHEAGLACERFA
jgi:hypothetical protein